MRTLRVRRNSRQGASALADCEVESTTVLSGTARSGRQKPRAQRIPSLPYQIICMFPYQFIWYKKSGRCGHRPLLPNKSFVTPPNSFGVYTNHLYVSVPFATSKYSSCDALDIFCVAAPANLLPSSATGSDRSRNQFIWYSTLKKIEEPTFQGRFFFIPF